MSIISDINTWAVICLVVGLVLMVIEFFTPGFGVAGGSGLILLAAAVLLQAKSLLEALVLLAGVLVILGITFTLAVRSAQKGRLANSPIILKDTVAGGERGKESLIGKEGITLTPLRPAGTARVGEQRMSVMTEGEWLDADTPIVVRGVDGVTPIVKAKE